MNAYQVSIFLSVYLCSLLLLNKKIIVYRINDENKSGHTILLFAVVVLVLLYPVMFGPFPKLFSLQTILFGLYKPALTQYSVCSCLAFIAILTGIRQAKWDYTDSKINIVMLQEKKVLAAFLFKRFLFLCVYELFFRGYLLFIGIAYLGVAFSIIISTVLYSLFHTRDRRVEFFSCIPFGTGLCYLCIWMYAVWPAILIHTALALSYEATILYQYSKKSNVLLWQL